MTGDYLVFSQLQVLDSGMHLKITNATESDTARYTCRAINHAGQASASTDLNVLGRLQRGGVEGGWKEGGERRRRMHICVLLCYGIHGLI
jgi:hypothetical protein